PGPVFANVVLVDEINRASPKTQSGLLECMQERRVTVDVQTHELARPVLVLATQHPIEYEGTYPLPEAQVDRFMVRISLGYPSPSAEAGMLADHEAGDRVLSISPVATASDVLAAQDAATRVLATEPLRDYVVRLLWRTREDPRVDLGASPRAGLMLLRAAKAHAMMQGRDHALPDDVQALGAERILEDEPLQTEIVVGWGRWGLPRAEIVDPLAAANTSLDAARSVPRRRGAAQLQSTVRFPRRGRTLLEPPSLVVRDGLDLARIVRTAAASSELLVLPRTEPVRWMGEEPNAGATHPSGGVRSEAAAAEVDGLRPY